MILIIQSRTDTSAWHELKCLYMASGMKFNEFSILNIGSSFVHESDVREQAQKADAIIIGGLGEVTYGETDPQKKAWLDSVRQKTVPVLKEVISNNTPTLGICFGHQLLAEATGSEVGPHEEQTEKGVYTIELTEAGKKDPLFANMPGTFQALEYHKDVVLSLPKGTTQLAQTLTCPMQSVKYANKVYGVQFHPELSLPELEYRAGLYTKEPQRYHGTEELVGDASNFIVVRNFLRIAGLNPQE